jgi:ribonuclease HI
MICKRWGVKADTSNNEMEYQAMLSAMELIPKCAYVFIESDSQGCIDGLTTYRKRWEKHGWRREDGKDVENAETIIPLAKEIDQRNAGFRKVKGHSDDPWNDLADSMAVNGRDQQSREVVIQLIFRAVINKKEKFAGFDRFSTQALANIYYFWPRLVAKCGNITGAPEEIISRRTPGFTLPSELRAHRRSSIDFEKKEEKAALPPSGKAREAPQVALPSKRPEEEAERDVPPHMRVSVTFQDQNGPLNVVIPICAVFWEERDNLANTLLVNREHQIGSEDRFPCPRWS